MSDDAGEVKRDVSGAPQETDAGGNSSTTGDRATPATATTRDPKTVQLSAFDLRALAEAVDGRRGRNFKIVDNPSGKRKAKVLDEGTDGAEVLLRVKADPKGTGSKTQGFFVKLPDNIKLPNGVPRPTDGDYVNTFDALFWSESAVDKFVAPYYIHMMTLPDLQRTLQPYYDDPDIVAFAHLPDSEVVETGPGDDPLPGLFAVTAIDQENFTIQPVMQQRR